jgi:hypothetical protein
MRFGNLYRESAKRQRAQVAKCNTDPSFVEWRLAKELLACTFWGLSKRRIWHPAALNTRHPPPMSEI